MTVGNDALEGDCRDHIALIITTSPVPSMPSTELITDLLKSLPSSLRKCDIVCTFDGFKRFLESEHRPAHPKRGQAPPHLADLYPIYIHNVKSIFGNSSKPIDRVGWGSEDVSQLSIEDEGQIVTFVEQKRHLGFAWSVKAALKYVTKKFALVLQHDWVFEKDLPMTSLLHIMDKEPHVNYITFMSRCSVNYDHSNGNSVRCRAVNKATKDMRVGKPLASNLLSFFHFLDRPHLMNTQLYRGLFEGGSTLTKGSLNFGRGDFIEDTLGARFSDSIKTAPSDELALHAWQQIGAWIFVAEDGERVLRHVHGRVVLVKEQQQAMIAQLVEKNRLAHPKS